MNWLDCLKEQVEEDIGEFDITTVALISKKVMIHANIIAREPGVVSGILETAGLFREYGVEVTEKVKDGNAVKADTVLLELYGRARDIFAVERTALNILGRMMGISTMTAEAVKIARKHNKKVRIAATRKTMFKHFDKKAVSFGGGDPHRWGLDDCMLIKTNHLRLVPTVQEAMRRAKKDASFVRKIEVEARSEKEAISAAEHGADIIMLDNMSHDQIDNAIDALKKKGLRDNRIIELSGGITLENLEEFAKHDCDVISMGCLTHSPDWFSVNLRTSGENP